VCVCVCVCASACVCVSVECLGSDINYYTIILKNIAMVGILVSIIVEVPWDFYVQYGNLSHS
jgi:hypothetical protein